MIERDEILRAAELIRAGRLVAFPTETVYGLGANALDAEAVDRIFAAKGRPATSPLIVHVSSVAMAKQIVSDWSAVAEALTTKFWPGPLTLVMSKQSVVPDRATAGLGTVGVRMPRHPVALALIEAAGVPIAAPSANRFTHVSPTTAAHVRESLGASVDLILDGGPTDVGIESTVVSIAGDRAVLLRPGMILRNEIESEIGALGSCESAGSAHPSPGMHRRHYSPRAPLSLDVKPAEGRSAWVWWNAELPATRSVRMPGDATSYASKLYEVLHMLDGEGWEKIVVEPVPETVEWEAVRDRLTRAAAQER